jgi:hypothetical protein
MSQIDSRGGRQEVEGMLSKMTRILLALVTAFVFTGQMEAAAEHCARLAHAAQTVVPADQTAPPCHEAAAAAASTHGQASKVTTSHHQPAHDPSGPATEHCECVAALNGFTNISGALASSHVVPYAWLPPEAAGFVSSRPDPDLRPPRA